MGLATNKRERLSKWPGYQIFGLLSSIICLLLGLDQIINFEQTEEAIEQQELQELFILVEQHNLI